jgi:hypothetical protein
MQYRIPLKEMANESLRFKIKINPRKKASMRFLSKWKLSLVNLRKSPKVNFARECGGRDGQSVAQIQRYLDSIAAGCWGLLTHDQHLWCSQSWRRERNSHLFFGTLSCPAGFMMENILPFWSTSLSLSTRFYMLQYSVSWIWAAAFYAVSTKAGKR